MSYNLKDMNRIIPLCFILLVACNNIKQKPAPRIADSLKSLSKTTQIIKEAKPDTLTQKKYANKRFRNVTVERTGTDKFLVHGQAQIFEANFSWVLEDGHDELKKGFHMTDAGAPEWGNFKFEIIVQKKLQNSTLTLILFESSPKDGSRQYELPITLY